MKPKVINLNNIFKAPLFRALSIIAIFFSFMFISINNSSEKVEAGAVVEWESGSYASHSNGTISLTSNSSGSFWIYNDCDCWTLGNNHLWFYMN